MSGARIEPGFRWPGRWFWALAACWIAGVGFYWWHFVPAVPERVIRYKPGQIMGGYTADALLFAEMGGLEYFQYRGPIDVVDVKTGAVLRSFGNGEQTYEHVPGVNRVLLISPQGWEVVDASTGEVVVTRPFDSPDSGATLSADGNRVAVNSGDRVSMFDVRSGEQLWSRQFRNEEPISARDELLPPEMPKAGVMTRFGQFVRVFTYPPKGGFSPIANSWWLNSRSGEPDQRFQGAGDIIESPDGRYVLVEDFEDSRLVSLDDNRTLCRIPIQNGEIYEFTPDSREIRELSLSEAGPRLSRWSIPDGKAIGNAATDPEREILSGWISGDGSRFAVCEASEGLFGSTWLFEELKRIGLARFVDSWNRIRRRAVLRAAHGSSALLLASEGGFQDDDSILKFGIQPLGRDDCFAVGIPEGLLIFSSDPPRDWWWLVGWGLGPVVVGIGALRWRAGRRGSKSIPA